VAGFMADLMRALDTIIRVEELVFLGSLLVWGLVLFTLTADLRSGKRRGYGERNAAS
jgi:hypothetical protein